MSVTTLLPAYLLLVASIVRGAETIPAPYVADAAERGRILAALPKAAPAKPAKPRKLLIFTLNVGYGGHPSISSANEAFAAMGERTGAFATVVSRDPEIFQRESLRQFDAVFFNNTVGNCFTNAELRRNLAEFIYAGGGLMGVHGTTVAFTQWPGAVEDWPEFGVMIGARGASHKDSDEHVWIRVEEPDHPLGRAVGGADFDYRDEFFRVGEPYSRKRVRVVLSIDTARTDVNAGQARGNCIRPDNDYALSWIRSYGRGRSFYCTIAHNPAVFADPRMLEFYLAAAQFALGDLPAASLPSAALTPPVRAQERLGWRLGIEAYTFHKYTLFEAIEKTAELGLPYIGGLSFQKVSAGIPKNLDLGLNDDELQQIRLKLDAAGLRMLTYFHHEIPAEPEACRRLFEFARKLGIETFMAEPPPSSLDMIGRLCDAFDIKMALHNHDAKASPLYWRPEGILEACRGRTPRIGACADIGYWLRSGIDPVEGLRKLGPRLLTVQLHDLHAAGVDGHDVPWGTGVGKTAEFLQELHRLRIQPSMIGLEYSYNWLESMPEIAHTIAFFNEQSLKLSPPPTATQ
jgi:type 1 glutamine amidotransferase/sugar phosphate isomerase/epimerase